MAQTIVIVIGGVRSMKKFIYGVLSVAMASLMMLGCGGDGGK